MAKSEEYKRVILVTGSNTGIGYSLVRELARRGETVYLSSRNIESGREAQNRLKTEDNLVVKLVQLDVTDHNSIQKAKDHIEQAEGRLDVLVNNAGLALAKSISDHDAATVHISHLTSLFEVNFFGLVSVTTAFIPLIRQAKPGYGTILNITSVLGSSTALSNGLRTELKVIGYRTSKAAVNHYTVALAHELKNDRIRVNCVSPGTVATRMNAYNGSDVETGVAILVPWVIMEPEDDRTGKYFGPEGEVPW